MIKSSHHCTKKRPPKEISRLVRAAAALPHVGPQDLPTIHRTRPPTLRQLLPQAFEGTSSLVLSAAHPPPPPCVQHESRCSSSFLHADPSPRSILALLYHEILARCTSSPRPIRHPHCLRPPWAQSHEPLCRIQAVTLVPQGHAVPHRLQRSRIQTAVQQRVASALGTAGTGSGAQHNRAQSPIWCTQRLWAHEIPGACPTLGSLPSIRHAHVPSVIPSLGIGIRQRHTNMGNGRSIPPLTAYPQGLCAHRPDRRTVLLVQPWVVTDAVIRFYVL